jgi:hypothetical protein
VQVVLVAVGRVLDAALGMAQKPGLGISQRDGTLELGLGLPIELRTFGHDHPVAYLLAPQ